MSNEAGSPIWYELITPDPDGAKRFYDSVIGWSIEAAPSGDMDYRMITAQDGLTGGVLRLTEDMRAEGAAPAWLVYVSVTDVDATAAQATRLGGRIFVPPHDLPGVGRFALLSDPHGALLYVMRTTGTDTSRAFAPGHTGHCGWNELVTSDMPAALAFYGALFGWENRETMQLGAMGAYHFLDLGNTRLGAAAEMTSEPAHWNLYFTVPDIDAAASAVRAGGGTIDMGPIEVPTGERILLGTDPQHAKFALVSPART